MSDTVTFAVGHLGWDGGSVGLVIYQGNDPKDDRHPRPRLLDEPQIKNREGATVIVIVLPGRFTPDGIVTAVAEAVVPAAMEQFQREATGE